MSKYDEYLICRDRGHVASGYRFLINPPLDVCSKCGTEYHQIESKLVEYKVPVLEVGKKYISGVFVTCPKCQKIRKCPSHPNDDWYICKCKEDVPVPPEKPVEWDIEKMVEMTMKKMEPAIRAFKEIAAASWKDRQPDVPQGHSEVERIRERYNVSSTITLSLHERIVYDHIHTLLKEIDRLKALISLWEKAAKDRMARKKD